MTWFWYKMTKSSVVDENSAVDKNLVFRQKLHNIVDENSDGEESSVVNCRRKFWCKQNTGPRGKFVPYKL